MSRFQKISIFLILIFVFRIFLIPGPRFANDFPFVSRQTLLSNFSFPQTWSSDTGEMGEYAVKTLWAWPLEILYSLGAHLGLSFEVLMRLFGIFPIVILGVYFMDRFLSRQNVSPSGRFVGCLLYVLNSFIILIIDGGQLQIGLSYAIFPWVYQSILDALEGSIRLKVKSGILVSVLGFLDIRFVYVLLVLLFIRFLYESLFQKRGNLWLWFFSWVKVGLVIFLVFVGLNFYWILPSIAAEAPALPSSYTRVSQASFLSFANIGHSLFLLSPHWYKNVFGKVTPVLPEFVFIPVLVFLAPVLKRKDRIVGFWLLVALIGIFLVKGTNPPLSGVYTWFFTNIPGFSLFRDPTKFFFLIALSYSVLIGITVNELMNYFGKLKIVNWKVGLIPLLLTSYFLILIRPVWLTKMTGTLSDQPYQKEYNRLADILEDDNSFGRVLWLPSRPPLGYASDDHPVVEGLRLLLKRPFQVGVVGSYELLNFIREAEYMGELFDIAAIKYIAYPYPDTRREELKKDNVEYYYAFLDQLSNLQWIDKRLTNSPVPLLQVKKSQDRFFIADNTFLIVGSDRIYNELANIENFDLSKNAFIFAEEKPGLSNICKSISCTVVLYEKNEMDFLASFIDKKRFIFPAEYLDFEPNEQGLWKRETVDFLWWRNFLQQKYKLDYQEFDYGGGVAIAEGEKNLQISKNPKLLKGYIIFARVMISPKGGKIEFFQDREKIGEVKTKVENPERVEIRLTGYKDIPDQISEFDKASFRWYEVGKLVDESQSLEIKTEGELNVVNTLAIIPEDEWRTINTSMYYHKVIRWSELSGEQKEDLFTTKDKVRISYIQISPTHYRVKIEGLTSPVTLSFSETYDSLWQLDGKSSYPLYSLINGFYIESDGEYDIFFVPQKYVVPGLVISGFTLFSIFILLFLQKKNKLNIYYNFTGGRKN